LRRELPRAQRPQPSPPRRAWPSSRPAELRLAGNRRAVDFSSHRDVERLALNGKRKSELHIAAGERAGERQLAHLRLEQAVQLLSVLRERHLHRVLPLRRDHGHVPIAGEVDLGAGWRCEENDGECRENCALHGDS